MRLLVLLPSWPNYSEVWLHRMISLVEQETVAVSTYFAPQRSWQGRIPVVELAPMIGRLASIAKVPPLIEKLGSRRLSHALRELEVTHVLCHYLTCALCFDDVWKLQAAPLFVHCHGYDVTWNLTGTIVRGMRRFRADYPDRVRQLSERAILIANSEFTKQRLQEIGVSANRICVKYLGVPVSSSPPEFRTERDEMQILFLGRLIDFKGPDKTIQAFELACRSGLRGRLLMAGSGPLMSICRQLRRKSAYGDRIELLGAVSAERAQELLRQSDLFTAHNCLGQTTHQQEAYGVSVVEAMAAGLPVTTGRSGGVCETVVPDVTGILFEPGRIEAQAESFIRLANPEIRQSMGMLAWQRAKNYFSSEVEKHTLRRILGL